MTRPRERTLVELVGAYRGRLELVGEHARRFAAALRATGLDREADEAAIEARFDEAWAQVGRCDGFVLARQRRDGGSLVAIARAASELPEAPAFAASDPDRLARGLALATSVLAAFDAPDSICGVRPKWVDESDEASRAHAAARAELAGRGVDEQLFVRSDGTVVGTRRANVFLRLDDELVTPSIESGAFPGILRAAVLHAAADLGVSVVERAIAAAELSRAQDAFLTRTIDRIVAVRAVDGRELAPPTAGSRWRRLVPQLRLRVHELCRGRFLPDD